MSKLTALENEFNELKRYIEELKGKIKEKTVRFDQLMEIMEYVNEARVEATSSTKEALDTLYMTSESNGGKATNADFLTAYKAAGVECELIQDVGDDESTIQEIQQEAATG